MSDHWEVLVIQRADRKFELERKAIMRPTFHDDPNKPVAHPPAPDPFFHPAYRSQRRAERAARRLVEQLNAPVGAHVVAHFGRQPIKGPSTPIQRSVADLLTEPLARSRSAQIRSRALVADSIEGGYAQCPGCDHRLRAEAGQRVRIQHNDDGSHTWVSLNQPVA